MLCPNVATGAGFRGRKKVKTLNYPFLYPNETLKVRWGTLIINPLSPESDENQFSPKDINT